MSLASIESAIEAIRHGEMVILVDDEDRENEGDLVLAAEKVTPEAINFMAKHGRGLICLSLTEERLRALNLPMMVDDNSSQFGTGFTVSVEARTGVTTGISAADRSHTIRVAVDDASSAHDLVKPGHVFPLRARPGGVLVRTGQTEGSVDLARLAGLKPAAVICEILNDDGTMARMDDLATFAKEHNLLVVSIADLINYRFERENLVDLVEEAPFPCEFGDGFRIRVYRDKVDQGEHVVLVLGDPATATEPVPVRVQHECLVGDVFRSNSPESLQLRGAIEHIVKQGVGVVVYLDNSPIGRHKAVRRYLLGVRDSVPPSEASINTIKPAFRDLGIGCQILADCGAHRIRVLSNSMGRLIGLDAYGLDLVSVDPVPLPSSVD